MSNGSEHLPEHATADAGSALDVAGIAAVLHEAHLRHMPRAHSQWAELLAPFPAEECGNCQRYAGYVAAHVEALREADRAALRDEVERRVYDLGHGVEHESDPYLDGLDDGANAVLRELREATS